MAKKKLKKEQKQLLTLGLIVTLIVAAYLIFSPQGLLHYLRLKESLATVQAANEELRQENEKLRHEIDRLHNDQQYLEEVARKRFGLIKKNELLFTFKDKGK